MNTHSMLVEFNVKTEKELHELLLKDCDTIPCIICKKKLKFSEVHSVDGDPYCLPHYLRFKYG